MVGTLDILFSLSSFYKQCTLSFLKQILLFIFLQYFRGINGKTPSEESNWSVWASPGWTERLGKGRYITLPKQIRFLGGEPEFPVEGEAGEASCHITVMGTWEWSKSSRKEADLGSDDINYVDVSVVHLFLMCCIKLSWNSLYSRESPDPSPPIFTVLESYALPHLVFDIFIKMWLWGWIYSWGL